MGSVTEVMFGFAPEGSVAEDGLVLTPFSKAAAVPCLGFDEAVATLPLLFEAGPDGVDFGAGDGWVGVIDEEGGFLFGEFEEIAVAGEVGYAELGEAGLFGAEELAGTALLEVEFGEGEAVLGLDHGVEAEFGFGGDGGGVEQDAEALCGATADAAAELVELGEAEAVGVFDDHEGGVGDVDADFDDGGGDEDVKFAAFEAGHGDLLVVGRHAAVEEAEAEAGEFVGGEVGVHIGGGAERGALRLLAGSPGGGLGQLLFEREVELGLVAVGAFDERVDDVGLTAGGDLLADEVPDFAGAVLGHAAGGDGGAAGREFVDDGDFEVAVEGECEGSGNGGCGHDEDVGFVRGG